jgi:hypothetical protein
MASGPASILISTAGCHDPGSWNLAPGACTGRRPRIPSAALSEDSGQKSENTEAVGWLPALSKRERVADAISDFCFLVSVFWTG